MTRFIDAYRDQFGVEPICDAVNVAPSTYYAAKNRQKNPSDRTIRAGEVVREIQRVWEDSGQLYGTHKVWTQLQREGIEVARCTVERLMRSHGLSGAVSRRGRPRTTVATSVQEQPADLVGRDFRAPGPNRLWVSDLTYVPLTEGRFCYAAFVTDVFSRAIVGWQVADTLETELALDALEMALWFRNDTLGEDLIHHGDRGVQYTAIRYAQRLDEAGIARSVGRKGDSYDNALAESIHALYKKEVINQHDCWDGTNKVTLATAEWVYWYNHQRLHSWCGHRPPLEYEQTYWYGHTLQPSAAA
ncbi:Transposase InsO and inactivated derivatives [Haloechinothrix alba]|uniref:Transposase InsO and inactivated derivatives n=2 Tax=Haloechinothrix alba TaxID=664784 RepID=A0A239A8F0_9PSEU|nr:Transposase InsO and inactivated derivatives [Haloechinothrix alba]